MLLLLRRVLSALPIVGFLSVAGITPLSAESIDSRPVLYLTFDDGPSADRVTQDLLQVLDRYDAKATFFVTGQRTRISPDKIAAILYAGHSLGNHTDSHARLTEVSRAEIFYELNAANVAVTRAGGPPLTCFRPPFGLTDARVNSIANELGLIPVKWTIDTRDWDFTTSKGYIREKLDRSHDGSIVLMHDGPIKRGRMLHAFEEWMVDNHHRFQFRTLPQCDIYGEVTLAYSVEEETQPETIDQLLEKLRAYRFTLDQIVGQASEPVTTAKLAQEVIAQ